MIKLRKLVLKKKEKIRFDHLPKLSDEDKLDLIL
jgi:hypothetical protein